MDLTQLRFILSWKKVTWDKPVLIAVGLLFLGWLLGTPDGLLGKADAVGYAVCHRIDLRSFHLGDRQIPLCARCTGMYLGAVAGLAYQAVLGSRKTGAPPWRVIVVLAGLVLAFAMDGLNSFIHFFPGAPALYPPSNTLRLLTGSGMGVAISAALFPAFNQTVWRAGDERPALYNLRSLVGLVAIMLLIDLVVLSENPLLLYPLALISAAGVLGILTTVYSMVWLMIFRAENRFESFRQLGLPMVAGFGLALLQIALLDFGRFLLTGTWEGFHIG